MGNSGNQILPDSRSGTLLATFAESKCIVIDTQANFVRFFPFCVFVSFYHINLAF